MKKLSYVVIAVTILSCNQGKEQKMQATNDSLRKELTKTYRPGLSEFMLGSQLLHAKLWFAGQNQNYPLLAFELHEIQESLQDLLESCRDRPAVKSISMIDAAIDRRNNS